MNPEMDRVEPRVDLTKWPGTYFVITDDEGVYDWNVWKDIEARHVLEVQRASDHPVELYAQREDLEAACDDSQSPLIFRTYQAVSQGHAAYLALREHADRRTFQELEDVFYADELAFTGAGFTDSPS
ncbi:hypothetical protein ACFVRD_37000 [Streptomyces sp. NPDC057908]|uniref:hypothetical protein n=1 Tax=Streptomyces sp. NPDC057908 TaxID=3346276 RepID=UPI0036F09CDC